MVLSLEGDTTFADRDALLLLLELRNEIGELDSVASVATIVPEVNPLDGSPITAQTKHVL